MKKVWTSYDFGPIFNSAIKAAERAKTDRAETRTAIIMAAIALEAFINEFEDILSNSDNKEIEALKTLKLFLRDLESSKSSIKLKVQCIYYILKNSVTPKGQLPYQDFNLLIDIRNALVHRKPEKVEWDEDDPSKDCDHHKYVKAFVSRKLIQEPKPGGFPIWSGQINEPEVAKWACCVTRNMVTELISIVPQSEFKTRLQRIEHLVKNLTN